MTWNIHALKLIDSTNNYAAAYVREALTIGGKPVDRQVFIADAQTAGRGQYDRTFVSPPGGLYMTAVLENPPMHTREPLPLLVGLSACLALEKMQHPVPGVTLRWPNDVLIGEGKVAGILCEAIAVGDRYVTLCGIGVNINTDPALLPFKGTSLIAADGRQRSIRSIAEAILAELDAMLTNTAWQDLFNERNHLRGRHVTLKWRDAIVEGEAAGVLDTGSLVVLTAHGIHHMTQGSLMQVEGQPVR